MILAGPQGGASRHRPEALGPPPAAGRVPAQAQAPREGPPAGMKDFV